MDDRTSRVSQTAQYASDYPTEYPTDNGRYRIPPAHPWEDDVRGDAPTEMFSEADLPLAAPYGRGGTFQSPDGMYGGMGALGVRSGAPVLDPPAGTGRTMRIVLGLICLFGSVASAVMAIVLFLASTR